MDRRRLIDESGVDEGCVDSLLGGLSASCELVEARRLSAFVPRVVGDTISTGVVSTFLVDGIDAETGDLTDDGIGDECPELPLKCIDSRLLCSGSVESGVRPKSHDCRGAVGMMGEHGDSTMDGRLILLWPGFRVCVWYMEDAGID